MFLHMSKKHNSMHFMAKFDAIWNGRMSHFYGFFPVWNCLCFIWLQGLRQHGIESCHKFKTFFTFVWFLYSINVHMSKSYNSMHFIQRVEATWNERVALRENICTCVWFLSSMKALVCSSYELETKLNHVLKDRRNPN